MNDSAPAFRFYDHHPAPADLQREVIVGLSRKARSIPPKYFYDEEGCRLFKAICATPEYYPTRTEIRILRENLAEIADCMGPGCLLIEPGSGDCRKVRELLPTVRPQAYVPMDISGASLRAAAHELWGDFPWLEIHAVCTDFTTDLALPYCSGDSPGVAFFPGSSIGNFDPGHAVAFLHTIAAMVGPGGGLLIGVDLKKDAAVLNAAYNDVQGLTDAFNRNLLTRLNRDLGANFDPNGFRHHAYYNEAEQRVEMHLISEARQQVRMGDWRFDFRDGDGIHTENSYKYTVAEFQELAGKAGFSAVRAWTDPERLFSVHYLKVAGSGKE